MQDVYHQIFSMSAEETRAMVEREIAKRGRDVVLAQLQTAAAAQHRKIENLLIQVRAAH